jgi:hypothetical protein
VEEAEQYQLFETSQYKYRVFVTNMRDPICFVVWFYGQPWRRGKRWLMLFNREPQADATALRHTTLATARLRFLFVAAKIWRHAGRTGVSYSDHYEEKGMFERLINRLRRIAQRAQGYAPVMISALR